MDDSAAQKPERTRRTVADELPETPAAMDAAQSGVVQLLAAMGLNWGASTLWMNHGEGTSQAGIFFIACSFALAWYLPLRYCRGWEWLLLPLCWFPSMLVFAKIVADYLR